MKTIILPAKRHQRSYQSFLDPWLVFYVSYLLVFVFDLDDSRVDE